MYHSRHTTSLSTVSALAMSAVLLHNNLKMVQFWILAALFHIKRMTNNNVTFQNRQLCTQVVLIHRNFGSVKSSGKELRPYSFHNFWSWSVNRYLYKRVHSKKKPWKDFLVHSMKFLRMHCQHLDLVKLCSYLHYSVNLVALLSFVPYFDYYSYKLLSWDILSELHYLETLSSDH